MRFDKVVMMMEIVFRSLVLFFVLAGMAWLLLGVIVLAGFLFLAVLIIYLGITGYISARLRSNVAETTDDRLSLMKSIVYGIRTVKMYAWELPFMETIKKIRRYDVIVTFLRTCELKDKSHLFVIRMQTVSLLHNKILNLFFSASCAFTKWNLVLRMYISFGMLLY